MVDKYDISKVMDEYGDDDFGFSAVSEAEYNKVISEKTDTLEEYEQKLDQLEKLVLPSDTKDFNTYSRIIL